MCGIAGQIGGALDVSTPVQHVGLMLDAIAHRGPDGCGTWSNGLVTLGHRRLSIVELSEAGSQPMRSTSGRYTISYNGELYNTSDLQRRWLGSTYRSRGRSDTELLLALIEELGLARAIRECVGMFAFALWDKNKREGD